MATAFEDAFKAAGFGPDAVSFLVAYAKLRNSGGTRQQADDLLDYADRQSLPGRGQAVRDRKGQKPIAPSRQPNGEAESHHSVAREGQECCAPASPPHAGHSTRATEVSASLPARGGTGRPTTAGKASVLVPVPREPSASQRAAAKAVAIKSARTFWDNQVGGVKRRIGSLTKFDVRQIVRRGMIDVHVGNRLLTEIEWPDEDTTPLESIGQIDHVKQIVESAAKALESSHV